MGTFPLGSGRGRDAVRHELVRRTVPVLSRAELPGDLVRVTLGGPELAGFASAGPADHVKAFFPTPDGPAGRDYTPSEYRPIGRSGGPELDLDFVVHGTDGPASAWALGAAPGDVLSFGGPRGSRLAPIGWTKVVLVADPSGLPALRRWIRAYADVIPVRAVLFGGASAEGYLSPAEVEAAGPRSAAEDDLAAAVGDLAVDGDTFVWAAGEAGALIPLRRSLKGEAALPAANLSLHGYWKRGDASFDHHAPLDPSDPD